MEYFTAAPEKDEAGKRIDVYISQYRDDLSRSQVQKLITDGKVTVNGKNIKSNYRLREKDIIDIEIPDPEPLDIEAEDISLNILYEDSDVIVIDKPQGMVVHPAPGHYSGTVVNALMYHCKDSLSGINGCMRPGIVHRIDMNTSGIIVAAKSDAAHKSLAVQFAEHSINRRYRAIVVGNIKEDTLTVDKPIGRNPKDRKKMAIVEGGKRAVTHFTVLERFGRYTYIEASLETGRTHQIRVHMAYSGHPLLGDNIYGSEKQPYKLMGQVLHAGLLGFVHPTTGEYMEFRSEVPEYFNKLLGRFREGRF